MITPKYMSALLFSIILLCLSYLQILPISLVETLGFIAGAASVWLTIKQNIWLWPFGIIGNIFFIILFWGARLYADMGLQVLYIVLSIIGWYWWLKGGKDHSYLTISRISLPHVLSLIVITIISSYGMMIFLRTINGAAPFLDAFTTVLSLVAQYLLIRKYYENWSVWMTADVIYIFLYFTRGLYLTGVLYVIFFLMCIAGLKAWSKSLRTNKV